MMKSIFRLTILLLLAAFTLSSCYDNGELPQVLSCSEGDVSPGNICYNGVWVANPDACVRQLELENCRPVQNRGVFYSRCGDFTLKCPNDVLRNARVRCGGCESDAFECSNNLCVVK